MEHLESWLIANLSTVIMSFLIIAMVGVMIWSSRTARPKAGGGKSYKSEFNVITAVTLVLIIAASVIALLQKNVAALIEIGIAVLVYAFFRRWISRGRGGRGGQ